MIGKKIANPKKSAGKSTRISFLVDYITSPEKENGLEKCIHSEALNFITDTHHSQVAEMTALASESVHSKNPIDHWVFSWRPEEKPTIEQVREAVNIFVKQCGLEEHQIIWGLHDDTQNMHVHLAVNRVHPGALLVKEINKGFWKETGQQVIALIEQKQGWKPADNSRYEISREGVPVLKREHTKQGRKEAATKPLQPSNKAKTIEIQTGEKSAQRIGIEEAWPIIKEARTWRELHQKLAAAGFSYERSGSGAIIHVGDTIIKASHVDRKASIGALQKRLGMFSSQTTECVTPDLTNLTQHQLNKGIQHVLGTKITTSRSGNHYTDYITSLEHDPKGSPTQRRGGLYELSYVSVDVEGQLSERVLSDTLHDRMGDTQSWQDQDMRRTFPIGSGVSSGSLKHISKPLIENQPGWEEYQIIQAERKERKEVDTLAIRLQHEAARKTLYEKQSAERKAVFSESWKGHGLERNAMQSVIATQQAAEKLEMQEQQRAERTALQAKYAPLPQYKVWKEKPQIVTAKEPQRTYEQDRQLSHTVRYMTHTTSQLGTTYKSHGVEVFRDEGKIIKVLNQESHNIAATLAVAHQKFGQTLTLTGDDEFKMKCVAAAVEYKMTVKFSDPQLEATRLSMVEEKRRTERAAQQAAQTKGQKTDAVAAEITPATFLSNPTQAQSTTEVELAPEILSAPVAQEISPVLTSLDAILESGQYQTTGGQSVVLARLVASAIGKVIEHIKTDQGDFTVVSAGGDKAKLVKGKIGGIGNIIEVEKGKEIVKNEQEKGGIGG